MFCFFIGRYPCAVRVSVHQGQVWGLKIPVVADSRRRHHPEFHRPADRAEHLLLLIAAGRSDRLRLQGSEWEVGDLGLEEVQEDPDGLAATDEGSPQPPPRLQLLCLRAAGLRVS